MPGDALALEIHPLARATDGFARGFGLGLTMYFASMGAQRMRASVLGVAARLGVATVGGWLLAHGVGGWPGMGPEGHFLGVALGLLAYGAIVASGVRPAVWRSPHP